MNQQPYIHGQHMPFPSQAATKERKDIVSTIGFALTTVVGVILSVIAPSVIDRSFCWMVLGNVAATLVVIFIKKSRERKPVNWLTPDVSFTLSFLIVHFLYILLWLTEFYELGEEIWYFRHANCPHTVCVTLAMCSACLAIFNLGYMMVKPRPRLGPSRLNKGWQSLGRLMTRLSLLGLAGFVIALGGSFWGGHYTGSSGGGTVGNTLFNIFQGLILASIAVLVISRAPIKSQSRKVMALDVVLVCIGALALLIHGDRSSFMLMLLAGIAAYSEFVKPFKLSTGIMAFVGLIMLMGIAQVARSKAIGERSISTFYRVGKETAEDSIEISARTFSGSGLTAFVAVDYVPTYHDYYKGEMKLLQIAGFIPFGRRILGIKQDSRTSTSNLFTLLVQGSERNVSGTGTSVFADFYVEGGLPCCLVVFFLFGMLFRWVLEKSRSTNDIRWHVALICLIAVLSISARMLILGLIVRQVIYPMIYTFLIGWLLGIRFRGIPKNTSPMLQPGMPLPKGNS